MTKTLTFTPIVLCQKKMKRITSNSSLATLNDSESSKYEKNRKIAQSVKADFIELVTKKNYSMKNAARIVKISYSTAKKIFTYFRQNLKTSSTVKVAQQTVNQNLQRSQICQISDQKNKKIQIFSLIAGSTQEIEGEYYSYE